MKCEICQKSEASVHFKQVNNGEASEMFVCEDCATKNGFDPQSPIALTDFLFGVGMQADPITPENDRICPDCRMKRSDFRKSSRLGCPECYQAFADDLAPMLEAMHKGCKHVGKVPCSEEMFAEMRSLQKALDQAVAIEDFEEAAVLRDRLKGLNGSTVL